LINSNLVIDCKAAIRLKQTLVLKEFEHSTTTCMHYCTNHTGCTKSRYDI